ncbi:MAG: CbbQ/NirQ/NorQ/GpvN family protein [Myxococcota bacterium]|nr:CbbQ/NirQ/NorQ/GpvN family protein [Myxococcota bacterium]
MRIITPPAQDFLLESSPWYLPASDEVQIFETAHQAQLPVLLKGPTGCGKTRFVAHMAHKLGRPLVTVACHEDLSAADLLGRFLILGDETVWKDGPLVTAMRHGAILYLDEVVEARKDTMVVIHPLSDDRRVLPIDKLGQSLKAPPEFMLVMSYNPGYQSVLKELKQSTRQRFISLEFDYPAPEIEAQVVQKESGVDKTRAGHLIKVAEKVRRLTDRGLEEGVSTRLLIHAGTLMARGIESRRACEVAFVRTLTDDADLQRSIHEVVRDFF